ncbi:MAG: hypothetical protein HY324_02700 [Chlamydiia bacterium]|nr:hypothetical protein [Chlamydiia bacterium]
MSPLQTPNPFAPVLIPFSIPVPLAKVNNLVKDITEINLRGRAISPNQVTKLRTITALLDTECNAPENYSMLRKIFQIAQSILLFPFFRTITPDYIAVKETTLYSERIHGKHGMHNKFCIFGSPNLWQLENTTPPPCPPIHTTLLDYIISKCYAKKLYSSPHLENRIKSILRSLKDEEKTVAYNQLSIIIDFNIQNRSWMHLFLSMLELKEDQFPLAPRDMITYYSKNQRALERLIESPRYKWSDQINKDLSNTTQKKKLA